MADPVSIAINIAIQVAISLAIAALTPKQKLEGPRLEDLRITTSTYGNTIPIGYGTVTVPGNVIWGREIEEVATKTDIGKGNPFSMGTQTTYEYFATFAVALCKRQSAAIIKIYADGKVIFDAEKVSVARQLFEDAKANNDTGVIYGIRQILAGNAEGVSFNYYNGDPNQEADPIISEDYPDGEVPAYRGTSYVVFNRLPLKDFGNRIPQLSFVVAFSTESGTPFSVVPRDNLVSDAGVFLSTSQAVTVDYENEVWWQSELFSAFNGFTSLYDLNTGQILKSITNTELNLLFPSGFREGAPSGSIQLYNHKIVQGNTPYAVLSQTNVSGITEHIVLDKLTFAGYQRTNDTVAFGGETRYNADGVPVTYYVDTSGGHAMITVSGLYSTRYYMIGSGGGTIGPIGFVDGISRDSGFNVYHLPNLDTYGITEIPGVFRCIAMVAGAERLGYTDVYTMNNLTVGAIGTDAAICRLRVNIAGIIISAEVLTVVREGAASSTSMRYDTTTANMRYDANRDILLVGSSGSTTGTAATSTYAFFMNTDGTDDDLTLGQIRELWYTEPGLFNASTIYDAGASAPLDGEFVASAPGGIGTYSVETGELLKTNAITNPYTDVNGAELEYTGYVFYYDKARRAVLQHFRILAHTGWVYIEPPIERGTESLKTVVDDIVLRSKLTEADIDTTELATKFVKGYIVGDDMTYRQAIEPLSTVYNFYAVENAGILEFKFKASATDKVIPEDDLVVQGGNVVFEEARVQESELPKAIYVEYLEFGNTDTILVQGARRISTPTATMGALGEVRFQFPMVLSDQEAQDAVSRVLYETWVGQERLKFALPQKYLDILPNDVLQVTAEGRQDNIRVERVAIGADLQMEVEGGVMDGAIYTQSYKAVSGIGSPLWGSSLVSATPASPLFGIVADAPFPDDLYATKTRDEGSLYITMAGPKFRDGGFSDTALLMSISGEEYVQRALQTEGMAYAQLIRDFALYPGPGFNGIQKDYFGDAYATSQCLCQVINGRDQFVSTDENGMLVNDDNVAMLWSPTTGNVEYINFQTVISGGYAVDNTAFNLEVLFLRDFLRGKRGTDGTAALNSFGMGDYLILMNEDTISGFWESLARNGTSNQYKYLNVSTPQFVTDPTPITYTHAALKPYAPVLVEMYLDDPSTGNRNIRWTRRSRVGASGVFILGTGDMPLAEDTESYEVDILDASGGNVVRTLSTTGPQAVYSAEQADIDFGTDFPNPLYVRVYQLSAQVGRGFSLEWELFEA